MNTIRTIRQRGPELSSKSPDCVKALIFAYDAMIASGNVHTASTLRAILLQQGCEMMTNNADDGRLTTAMNIAIFG